MGGYCNSCIQNPEQANTQFLKSKAKERQEATMSESIDGPLSNEEQIKV